MRSTATRGRRAISAACEQCSLCVYFSSALQYPVADRRIVATKRRRDRSRARHNCPLVLNTSDHRASRCLKHARDLAALAALSSKESAPRAICDAFASTVADRGKHHTRIHLRPHTRSASLPSLLSYSSWSARRLPPNASGRPFCASYCKPCLLYLQSGTEVVVDACAPTFDACKTHAQHRATVSRQAATLRK